ncbi:hypothetical protein FKW77_005126 [Venturia effusa]|uniref:SGNH hydrolase-type esterase domain-containing protein n=1 Tax=Venturia effusa TaxID=50376 RepID=A0A517LIP7_9PEZI|nr:hypothetical protein FKW77_005126 [Venturia effusa]
MSFVWITLLAIFAVRGNAFAVVGQNQVTPAQPDPSNGHWIDTWASMPQLVEPANLPPSPFNQKYAMFVNSTIRQTLKVSVGASQIRLRISNAFGKTPLPIAAVTVAFPVNGNAGIHEIQPDTLRTVTFSGSGSFLIPNGSLAVSDPLDFKIKAESVVTVTIYLKDGQRKDLITGHPGSRTTSWFQFGDAAHAASFSIFDPFAQSTDHWYFLSSIEAWVPPSYGSFVIIGDSITDGRGSDTNKNNRWPDLLLSRLQQLPFTSSISIANLAAGGNRILADGLGPSVLSRLDRDLAAHPGVKYAMVFEGVNDIGRAPSKVLAQQAIYTSLIQAYKQIVDRIHTLGLPAFAGTITPFSAPAENATQQPYSTPEREKTRMKVNKWLRESGVFDFVVDFDAMVRDPDSPSRLKEEFSSGDFLHPNVKGYQQMADEFPVEIFERFRFGVNGPV